MLDTEELCWKVGHMTSRSLNVVGEQLLTCSHTDVASYDAASLVSGHYEAQSNSDLNFMLSLSR